MTTLLIQPEQYSATTHLHGECHLWFLDVAQLSDTVIANHKSVLSEQELMRALVLKRNQLQFTALREFVRLCLSRYTNTPANRLIFATQSKGKPVLENMALPIKFNLSHCNNMAVLAVTLHDDIGVDIESITRNRSRDIATRYFHPLEVENLEQLKESDYTREFFRLWTLKEAFFKATGDGISAGLDKARFAIDGDIITAAFAEDLHADVEHWQFHQTFLTEDYCIALARQSKEPVKLRWFDGTHLFS